MRAFRTFSSKFLTSPTQILASKPPNSAQIWELRAPKICLSSCLISLQGLTFRDLTCPVNVLNHSAVFYLEVGWIVLSNE